MNEARRLDSKKSEILKQKKTNRWAGVSDQSQSIRHQPNLKVFRPDLSESGARPVTL